MVVSSYWVARRRTRATVPGLVGVAPLPRRGSAMVTGVVAVPCQLISAWQVKAGRSMVRVISLITARISCLRWLLVVAGASKTARMSAPARRSQASSSLVSRTGCRVRAAARAAWARSAAARRCSSRASRVRATSRLPGSTSSCLRMARSASNQASAGDLIICRANDHHLEAGEPGRTLANGDVLRIEAITGRGIMVRRLLDPDPATGQRRFTDRAFRYTGYHSSDLAYAVTGHSAQGATVHTGIALITGTEDRQWLYPAMTRGTDVNLAFVFTTPPRPADL